MKKPMFFFTDYDLLDHQEQVEELNFLDTSSANYTAAFGKISYSNSSIAENCLLLTSTHKSISSIEPYAYAICDGYIAVLPVKDSNLVNIILKPILQPNLPLPKIKYFIYRGILRDSLFKDSNNPLSVPGFYPPYSFDDFPAESQQIIYDLADISTDPNKINNVVQSIRRPGSPTAVASSLDQQYMDIRTHSTYDWKYLDSLFVPGLDNKYPANWKVEGGWILGNFPSANNNKSGTRLDRFTVIPSSDTNYWYYYLNIFGLEIMLDTLDYNPTVNLVKRSARVRSRGDDNIEHLVNNGARNFNIMPIEEYGYGGLDQSTKNKNFVQRASVEAALNYLDPAAFFGSFYSEYIGTNHNGYEYSLMARKHADGFYPPTDGITKPVFTELKGSDIYVKILRGEVLARTHFANKNRVYFDIRNNFNNSYNFYQDNCYNYNGDNDPNSTNPKIKENILFKINDGHTGVDERILKPRNYYNRHLPLLFFEKQHVSFGPSDDNTLLNMPNENYFCNDNLSVPYGVSFRFPTVNSPTIEQYSLFHLIDTQYLENKQRITLSADNNLDSMDNSHLYALNYSEGEAATNEILININTFDSDDGSTIRRVPVAGYYRFTLIKHRTFLDEADPASQHPLYSRNPTDPSNAMKVLKHPQPVEFLDYVFNMDMLLTFGIEGTGQLQTKEAEELRYADISRTTGRDMVGQTGVARDSVGNMVFYVNGKYHRGNNSRSSLANTTNIMLAVNSMVVNTSKPFLSFLADTATVKNSLVYSVENNVELLEANAGNPLLPGTKPLDFFAFVSIPKDDWIKIRSYFDSLISGKKYYKVYLCFRQIDDVCSAIVRYQYYFKGFTIAQQGTQSIYTIADINPESFSATNPSTEYRHRFPSFGSTNYPAPYFLGSVGQSVNNPFKRELIGTTFTFGSDAYLMRAMALVYSKFVQICKVSNRDLEIVFSSNSNKGWYDIINPSSSTVKQIVYQGKTMQATPVKCAFLRNAEVIFFVSCKPLVGTTRSYAVPARRMAVLYFDPVSSSSVPDRYTAAHEYGHILGLADRYGYIAEMSDVANNLIGNKATTMPLYVAGDEAYNTNYRWYFNLMARSRPVPSATQFPLLPFGSESAFINMYGSEFVPSGPTDEWGYYQQVTIFISPEQFDVITGTRPTESPYFGTETIFLFPKNSSPATFDNLSFIGRNLVGGALLSDHDRHNSPIMFDRSNSPSICLGWIRYDPVDSIANDIIIMEELRTGGVPSEKEVIAPNGVHDLTGDKDKYYNIGTPNALTGIGTGIADDKGLQVWRYAAPGTPSTVLSNANRKITIKYREHPNRTRVIQIIANGR